MLRPPAYRQQTCTHTQKSPAAAAAGKTETLKQTILLSLGKVDQTSCSWVVQTSRLQPYTTYPIASCRLLKVLCPTHFRSWSSWTVCASSTRALKTRKKPSLLACRKRRNSYLCQYHQKLESVLSAHKDLKFAAHQSNQLSGELPAAPHTQKAVAVNCSS